MQNQRSYFPLPLSSPPSSVIAIQTDTNKSNPIRSDHSSLSLPPSPPPVAANRGEERHKAAREARSYSEFNYRTGRRRALSSQRSRPESRPPLTAGSSLSLGERTTFPDWDLASRTGAHHVRPVSTQHPSPSIWTDGRGGGRVKRVSHLEESWMDKALCRASPSSWPWNRSSWRLCIFIFRR